jgi:DNA modification methylase
MRGEHVVGGGKVSNQHVKGVLMTSDSGNDPAYYFKKQAAEKKAGRELTTEEFQRDWYEGPDTYASGTSIFDPVLCELAYSWFCPPGGTVLDPFAGGSVRGIVASKLGRQYIGVELRKEQVEANRMQGDQICQDLPPVWHTGDSRNIDRICADVQADFVFSCPPYADLEVYSDDPADLSTLNYEDFRPAYFDIIAKTCSRLKQDRFACFVVGDVRDKKGNYYNFVGDTVQAFQSAGLHYYNEAVLVTAVGSLPIRVGKQFTASRKLGKTHQNVLVFVKGDGKRATQACGPVEVHIPDAENADLGEEL